MKTIKIIILTLLFANIALAENNDYKVNFRHDKSDSNYSIAEKFWLKNYPELKLDGNDNKIEIDTYDIDDDGVKEIISTLKGEEYCGSGGCMISIIKPLHNSSNGYKEILWHQNDHTSNKFLGRDMKILQKTTNNFHNIAFPHNISTDNFKWNKNRYELSNN